MVCGTGPVIARSSWLSSFQENRERARPSGRNITAGRGVWTDTRFKEFVEGSHSSPLSSGAEPHHAVRSWTFARR